MKNTCVYHLCVSCKKGLMFRGRRDYIRFINNMALLAYKYHIRILAFAVMSNHYHIGIMTDDFEKFFKSLKVSYSNYYYHKYGASLPRTSSFVQEAIGNLHIVTLIAYVLRNPVHHGIVGHPFAYPYSSAGCCFSYNGTLYSIGHAPVIKRVTTTAPNEYSSNSDREGMIDPMTFVDFRMTETLFTSSGRLMYFLSRYSGPKWEQEQRKEDSSVKPITLQSVECQGIDIEACMKNEKGHSPRHSARDGKCLKSRLKGACTSGQRLLQAPLVPAPLCTMKNVQIRLPAPISGPGNFKWPAKRTDVFSIFAVK